MRWGGCWSNEFLLEGVDADFVAVAEGGDGGFFEEEGFSGFDGDGGDAGGGACFDGEGADDGDVEAEVLVGF